MYLYGPYSSQAIKALGNFPKADIWTWVSLGTTSTGLGTLKKDSLTPELAH